MTLKVFDRSLLRHRRERAQPDFDQYDFLLRRAAEEICDRLEMVSRAFPTVLDAGAHTGLLGRTLSERTGTERVIFMDDVSGFIETRAFVSGDMEALPFAHETFDLVVSGLSLQFVNDLPGSLLQIRRVLKADGLFMAVLFGGGTLHELREAFAVAEEELEGGVSPRVAPFVDIRDAGALLQRAGFALPVADMDRVTVSYETPFHLMRDLRGMGWSNMLLGRRKIPLRRSTLMRMVETYQERFGDADGRVSATFELLSLSGWAPDDSQQKPLAPGSAQTRLADALNTEEIPAGEKPER